MVVVSLFIRLIDSQSEFVEADVRSLRKALNLDVEDGESQTGINKRAIIETLCARSPERVIAAREYYERCYDSTFVQSLQAALSDEPILSTIISALVSHNRHELRDRTDFDGGSVESFGMDVFQIFTDHTFL